MQKQHPERETQEHAVLFSIFLAMLLRHSFSITNTTPTFTYQHLKCRLQYMVFPGWKTLGTLTKLVKVCDTKEGLTKDVYARLSFQERAE